MLGVAYPWRMWFGPPQIGEGLSWYIAALISGMVFMPLWHKTYTRDNLLFWSGITMLVVGQLHLLNTGEKDIGPWLWSDYLMFMYPWFFIAVMSIRDLGNKRLYAGLAGLLLLIMWVSDNDAGNILVPYAALITTIAVGCHHYGMPHFKTPGKMWRLLAMLACLLPAVWMFGDSKANWFPERWHGVNAREELTQMGIEALARDPLRLLIGGGWYGFADDQFRYKMPVVIRNYDQAAADFRPEGLTIDEFHSHNQPLEALLSLGIVGFVLWFALPLTAIWRIPAPLFWRCVPMMVAVTLVSYFWFLVPQLFAFQVMCWVALCSACEKPVLKKRNDRTPLYIASIASLALLWSAYDQLCAMRYSQESYWSIVLAEPANDSGAKLIEDERRGGVRFAQIVRLWLDASDTMRFKDLSRWYPVLEQAARHMANSPKVDVYVAFKGMEIKNKLFFDDPSPYVAAYREEALSTYPEMILQLAKRAPGHEKLAVPYLQAVAEQLRLHPDKKRVAWLREIIATAPDFSSALWVLGEYLARSPATQEEGKRMQTRAMELGVAKIYPVTKR